MNASELHSVAGQPSSLSDAITALEALDRRRNLSVAAAIFLFFAASGVAVLSFFIISDLLLWAGVDELVARFLIALAWIAIFPVWILAFLAAMWLLDAVGIADMRAVAMHRLSALALGPGELDELHRAVANRQWQHGRIYERVIADLAHAPTRPQGGDTP